jgi:hypothetical protein
LARARSTAQASEVTYELHTLGWKAFQGLCATICGEIWGQTIQTFFDSSDGGRDGAFNGMWRPQRGEAFAGSFTVQCKFTAKRDKQLALSDLHDELQKAARLAKRGLSDNYIVLTNAHVKGTTAERIEEIFLRTTGIQRCEIHGVESISRIIRESSRLRLLVPRVYGLGDLSQIFDERAYAQARELLSALGDDLSKFVITDPFRQSTKALVEHGFVLLLGEPASGKSTIAASLAVGALDEWGCSTLKMRDAEDFVRHSNPHEPKQFFWIDDAFGATQLDWSSVSGWNRVFPHIHAALRRGARVVMTSRDYIYRSARQHIKEAAFPLMRESQVVIQVERLTKEEKEQILYNHIRLGAQPMQYRSSIKPYLIGVAEHPKFTPEIARRLGTPFFTRDLAVTAAGLADFVERPLELLMEVIRTLDPGGRSALALVFMRGGILPSPLHFNSEEEKALRLLGGELADVRNSLNALDGGLVLQMIEAGNNVWRFKHPTVRDALAALIAEDRELLDIYVTGMPLEKLLGEVSAGDVSIQGVKVIVPRDRYDALIDRLNCTDFGKPQEAERLFRFLAYRCDREFLIRYLATHAEFLQRMRIGSYLDAVAETSLFLRLHKLGLLPEPHRKRFVKTIEELAVETPDANFLDESYQDLFAGAEFQNILTKVRIELLPNLDGLIWEWRSNYENDGSDPVDHFYELTRALKDYRDVFSNEPDSVREIDITLKRIKVVAEEMRNEQTREPDNDYYMHSSVKSDHAQSRSTFDDVDE